MTQNVTSQSLFCHVFQKSFKVFYTTRLQSHRLVNDAIPEEHFGFLPKCSTVWQILAVIDDWENVLDSGDSMHIYFLDMAKAFNWVNPALLLQKLSSVGVHALELKWFKSYLTDRSICTLIGVRSSSRFISSGVPQGFVLRPRFCSRFFSATCQ